MPFYDLRCKSCGKEFSIKASIAQRSQKEIPCPQCGGRELDPVYRSSPNVILSKSDQPAACPNAARCGGCCPHSRS